MYREHAPTPELQALVTCTWQHTAAAEMQARVVPDACIDIVWRDSRLSVAGPDTRPVHVELSPGTQIVGLRFAPGSAATVLGVPASALCDSRVALTELWGDAARALQDALHAAPDAAAAARCLERAVLARRMRADEPDPLVPALLGRLRPTAARFAGAPPAALPRQLSAAARSRTQSPSRAAAEPVSLVLPEPPSVAALARALGVSERQLLRRSRAAFGYGPKVLGRILRFQAFRGALRARPRASLAQLAQAFGYADQAHLTHEVRELAGVPPSQLKLEAERQG